MNNEQVKEPCCACVSASLLCWVAAAWAGALILTALMNDRFRMEPRTGILLMKPTMTGKKPLDERT